MFAYICLLAFIGLGSGTEIEQVMPSRFEIESSINRTIEEVEKMVKENPSLPSLSRNDIVNILYNITTNDMTSAENEALNAIQKTREHYQRALMVVLPYKPENSGENLKELFTKPPLTQMVEDGSKKDSEIQTAYDLYSKNNAHQFENLIDNKHQLISTHMRFDNTKEAKTTERIITQRYRLTTTTAAPRETKPEAEPQKFTFSLDAMDQRVEASHTSIATKRPIYRGTFSRYRTSTQKPPKLEIITSTPSKVTTTTEKLPETTTAGRKLTNNVLSSNQWRYNAPPRVSTAATTTTTTTTTTTSTTTKKPEDSPWRPMAPSEGYFVPTVESDEISSEQADEPNFAIIPVETFPRITEAPTTTTTRSSSIFVTPSTTANQKKVNDNKPVPTSFKMPTTAETTTMRAEVEQLLKSIGLQPMKPVQPQNDAKINNKNKFSDQLNAYLDSYDQYSKHETVRTNSSPKPTTDNSFLAPISDIKEGVKNLSPDIQLLFQQFGLQANGQQQVITTTTTTTTTAKPTRPSNSYTHFKPLPTAPVRDLDFRNFLARFGLGLGDTRNQKAIQSKPTINRPSLIDAVPESMKKILENIGLIKRTAPKVELERPRRFEIQTQASKIVEKTIIAPIEHVFKPQETDMNNAEQNDKIKNLLNTVKKVQEGKAGVQDVQNVAHDLLQSTKSLANGPDPVKLEEILSNYRNSLKNEVKRQQKQIGTITRDNDSAATATEKSDDITLSSIATTDSSGSFSENSDSSSASSDVSSTTKNDESSLSSATDEKTEKPNFFDTFDINKYTNSDTASSTSATPSSSSSTGKPNFFDTFDVNSYISSTEVSAKNAKPSADDLEESFGGSTSEPDPVLPTRPKTGLYFLVDWNSFLEVGTDDSKDKVNLRFSPKVGDKTRFIPVKVP